MNTEYYFTDFPNYSLLFKGHSIHIAELMKILDDEIINLGLPPVGKSRDLFQMAMDLSYHVDQSYEDKFSIKNDSPGYSRYLDDERIADSVRTVFREEFNRFMEKTSGAE